MGRVAGESTRLSRLIPSECPDHRPGFLFGCQLVILAFTMGGQEQERTSPYIEQQYSENYPPGVEHTYWHLARNAIVVENLRALSAKTVLDIGCGRGILV